MGQFLPGRLKKAREDAGSTQEGFARSLGVSPEFISLLESGKRAPSLDTLSRIAEHFHKDPSYFLGEKEPAFTVLFRAPGVDLSPNVRLELERFRRYVDDYLRLEEATGRSLQPAPLYSGRLTPERMASEERRRLGLGDEPIRDIFALLERNGLRILRMPLPPDAQISGAFIYIEAKEAAFALVNSAQTPCRQVFTAAHEYCHYLKDRHNPPVIDSLSIFGDGPKSRLTVGGSASERRDRFAQDFAAHFLMPPTKVIEMVGKGAGSGYVSYEDVLLTKRYFGVSTQAMLKTLRSLGLLTAAKNDEYAKRDTVRHERQIFGATDEDYMPGAGRDSAGFIVSDRYRLLEREVG